MTTVGPNAAEREINAVYNDVANNKIYFAGNFVPITSSTVYCAPGINKYRIARINSITGSLDSWNPNINNNIINGNISAICVVNNTVFLAGPIASTSLSTPFMGLVGVDANTGNIVSTFSVTGGSIKSLVYTNNLLICAGSFTAFNGNVCNSKIAVLNLQTSSVSYSFSHPIINNPYATNYMPGYNGNVLETKIINNKIYAIAEDPNLSAHSILEVDLSTMNIKRRLSIFSNYYSFNRFTEQNDSLFIFPNPVLDNYTYQCIKIINNVDIGVPATILPANLKNWHFGFKLSQTAGVTAVFSRTIDSQWFPATIDNTNYDNYPGSLLYDYSPQTIINGNKIHIVSHNSVGGEYYKKSFYKNGNLCTEAIDDNNLNLLNQGNFILLKDFVTHGNRAFLFRKTATWTNEMSLEEFCLKPDPPLKPKAIGNYTTFCAGNTYSFVLLNPSFIKTFSWGYTGTGATFQNTNNDTVFVTFNQNATPGNVFATGTSDCNNVKADTAFTSISFIPSPQISAKIQDTLNCYNNLQKNLFASSSSASTTIKWYAPSSPTTAVFSNSILANATGVY
ncbi:MAG: hypothetical protein JNM96_01520, partial [Bacteroidia bacterium]|nr:hypothetical protein [Bacteroidia bacterium]